MKILVCMKQVPQGTKLDIDPETGALKRQSGAVRTNPYDLFALETALTLRDHYGGTVTVLTMGPDQAESMMKDAFACGADDAVILSDRRFAGADVLATSYALMQAVKVIGLPDLIICGRQTTDGDTAQVGPALAEHLGIPHAAWVREILFTAPEDAGEGTDELTRREKAARTRAARRQTAPDKLCVRQDLASVTLTSELPFPCLITVDKDTCVPRLPSYRLKKQTADRKVRFLRFHDLPDQREDHYGLSGSPTSVVRMFAPPEIERQVYLQGSAEEKTGALFRILTGKKYI